MEHSERDCTPHRAKDEVLVSVEYEAGYQARIESSEDYRTATPSWRSGWDDADHDLQSGALSNCSGHFEPPSSQWSNFGTGRDARLCELPFDVKSKPE